MSVEQRSASEMVEEFRPLLLSIAYRMFGRATDTEDVVGGP